MFDLKQISKPFFYTILLNYNLKQSASKSDLNKINLVNSNFPKLNSILLFISNLIILTLPNLNLIQGTKIYHNTNKANSYEAHYNNKCQGHYRTNKCHCLVF